MTAHLIAMGEMTNISPILHTCPIIENKLVFPNNEGNYQRAENMMKRRFIPALNRADIELVRFHDLRYTYASLLLVNGAPMKYVQHQL